MSPAQLVLVEPYLIYLVLPLRSLESHFCDANNTNTFALPVRKQLNGSPISQEPGVMRVFEVTTCTGEEKALQAPEKGSWL